MSLHNVQRSKSGSSILFEKAITLAPILSHKSRNVRDFPFCTTLQTRKQETMKDEFTSTLNNRLDKNWRSLKECLERVQKKRSLQSISQNIDKSEYNKKQMFLGKQQSKLKAKASLGHFVKRSNGILPCRYGITNKRDIFVSKTEISEQKRDRCKQRKQLSETKMSKKTCLSKLLSLNKIETHPINKIRSSSIGTNESLIEQNEHHSRVSIDKRIKDEINKVSICLAKGNHKSLRDKVRIKENCLQAKTPYLLQKIEKLNISLYNTGNNDDAENESMGLGESVIEEQISVESNFAEETDRYLLDQIQLPLENRLNKKIWKRLPCDFLNIN